MKNLKFKYISAQNFLCFGSKGIELKLSQMGNIILVRGENKDVSDEEEKIAANGIGKSSIADAIVYALYGKMIKSPKKLSHDNIINNRSKKKLKMEVRWDKYRVIRTRKPNAIKLWEAPDEDFDWDTATEDQLNDYEITKGGMPATQEEIERILGLKYETFVNLFVFTDSNNGVFLESDKPEKRTFVENLLYLEKYKGYWETAKKRRNLVKDKIKNFSSIYEMLLMEKESAFNRIKEIEGQEKQWKENKKVEINNILKSIKSKKEELTKSDIGKALNEYNEAQEKIELLEKENVEYDSKVKLITEKLSEVEEKFNELKLKLVDKQGKLSEISSNISGIKNELKTIDSNLEVLLNKEVGATCSHCYGTIQKENYEHVINELNSNKDEIGKSLEEKLVEKDKLNEEVDKLKSTISQYKEAISKTNSKKDGLDKKIFSNKSEIKRLSGIKKPDSSNHEKIIEVQIEDLKKQALAKKEEMEGPSPYEKILLSAQEEAKSKEKECSNKKSELKKIEKDLPYDEFWVKGFGEDGIRKSIIDGIFPALNARINYWLQYLIDGKIKLTFNNQLEETIERNPSDGDPFVYYAMSGGERRRLNLAVSQAFAYIMTLNSGVEPSLVFLDEVTINIDPIGVVGIYNMIMELSKDKQVFVTTHDQDLLQMLSGCETINLVKENGISSIIN